MLVDPVLAFIKAFRLRGDSDGLRQSVTERFDTSSLVDAKKRLWDECSGDLGSAGLFFHARRGSEKRSQAMAELEDILEAFESLDASDKLPSVYCEATDLLKIPPLALDPISEQLLGTCKSLDKLGGSVQELKEHLSATRASLSKDLATVKAQISRVQSASPVTHSPDLAGSVSASAHPHLPRHSPSVSDRLSNLILFGLEEKSSLSDTKASVDEVLEYIVGRPIGISDLLRLGRPNQPSESVKRPRPVLIKLSTAWDRRLVLASRRKLKDFRIGRLFIREDLSPEERAKRRRSPPVSGPATVSSGLVPPTSSGSLGSHVSAGSLDGSRSIQCPT